MNMPQSYVRSPVAPTSCYKFGRSKFVFNIRTCRYRPRQGKRKSVYQTENIFGLVENTYYMLIVTPVYSNLVMEEIGLAFQEIFFRYLKF